MRRDGIEPERAAIGLSSQEAARRLARYGPNLFIPKQRRLVPQLLMRFGNPLVLVLLAASAISTATGDAGSASVIAVIVLMSVVLDFIQERRAGHAAEQLAHRVAPRVRVWRDGREQRVTAEVLVPGDVVLLAAGDLIPADAQVLQAQDFFVNQALLTGEPYPVERHAAATALPDRGEWDSDDTGAIFMGSSVVSGSARALVRRTAKRTAIGQIATTLEKQPPPTAFELGARRFGLLIMRLTVLLMLFTLLVNAAFHRPLLESFLFAVALAVGLTPELLPMVVSITLARGAMRMAKAKVIVKRLSSLEDMGSMDVLCTDKTGTLTEASIRLECHLDAQGKSSERVLELAYLNSFFESGLKNPMDEAILAHETVDVSAWTKIDEVPFDFERRRVSVLVERAGERLLVLKGAPEDVLRLCSEYESGSLGAHEGPSPGIGAEHQPMLKSLDEAARRTIHGLFEDLGQQGYRVLAIAWKREPDTLIDAVVGDESQLVFAGFAGFLDPPKASAKSAMDALSASGVAVKIITGDSEQVARHVFAELGMEVTGVLTGMELAAMNDDALRARVESVNLFARANPQQKNRVLLALKSRGHVVGYMGDGINDAPALHTADVGISVDSAVDVAKQAADMILLENDLHVLHNGIREGRRTFGNVMKYILMATSSNFGNMFSMAAATLFLPFLPMLPLQILLNNFLYDMSELPIPLDNVDEEDMAAPHRWEMSFIRDFMWFVGPISSVFDFATFWLLLNVLDANEALFHTGWFVESLATQVLVIFIIRTRGSPLASRPHPALMFTAMAVIAVAIILPFTPLAEMLGFVALPVEFFGLLAGLLLAYLMLVEAAKRWFYRHVAPRRFAL